MVALFILGALVYLVLGSFFIFAFCRSAAHGQLSQADGNKRTEINANRKERRA